MNLYKYLLVVPANQMLGGNKSLTPSFNFDSKFTFMLPSIYFCRLNLLIIWNQNLPISGENDYDFGKILLSHIVYLFDLA